MNCGFVSITTLIGNCSLPLSVLACLFFWQEPVSAADLVGLTVLMIGIVLTTFRADKGKFGKKWLFCSLLFLVLGAGVGITFKAFSRSGSTHAGDMMLIASAVMLVSYAFICFFGKGFTSISVMSGVSKRSFVISALLCGILSCLYNRLNIYLSSVLDAVVFFPSFNGGVVVVSTLLSVLLLGERLKARQTAGIMLGVLAICIIGIF